MNCEDKCVIRRHCGRLLREEGGLLEAAYKRDRKGVCSTRVKNRGGEKCEGKYKDRKNKRVKEKRSTFLNLKPGAHTKDISLSKKVRKKKLTKYVQ